MSKHNGQIIEYVVRRKGYNLTALSLALDINRRSIYNWFQDKNLKIKYIHKIGNIINHDFSVEFPEFSITTNFEPEKIKKESPSVIEANINYQLKYIELLEKFNGLLADKISTKQ
jgi:predicted transcriptional regulator